MKHLEVILYPESNYDSDGILSVISQYKSIKKYFFILHDQDLDKEGNPKKPHYHVYLNFGKASIQMSSAAQWFGVKTNCIQRVKGHMIDVIRYYTHEKYPDKHQYTYKDITANFDIEAFVASEDAKLSLDEILERCASGEITPLNHQFYIPPLVYVKNADKIERSFKYANELQVRKNRGERSMSVAWLAGETGTGKSTYVKLIAQELGVPFYFTAAGNDPFSKYVYEPVVALDDIRPNEQFTYSALLKLLDSEFDSPVHSRYSDIDLLSDYVFITSPYLPHTFVSKDLSKISEEGADQLYRRLDEVIYFTKDDIILCYLDEEAGIYRFGKRAPNPAKKYYEHRQKEKPKPTLEIIGEKMLLDTEQIQIIPGFTRDDDIPF